MERWAFKKVEAWIAALIAVFFLVGALAFGVVVRNAVLGHDRFGVVGEAALAVVEVPVNLRKLLADENPMRALVNKAVAGKSGWRISELGDAFEDYILLSRYDASKSRYAIELFDVRKREVVHVWYPDANALLDGVRRETGTDKTPFKNWNTKYFRYIHPFLTKDGHLIVKNHESPLMRIDHCGRLVWRQENDFFHHSTEIDAEGAIWVPGRVEPPEIPETSAKFLAETLFRLSLDGEILFRKSLAQLLVENGLEDMLFALGNYKDDRMHLNDIQPVLEDGPYWKRGDVFLSLRNLSMIVLYRPSENKIVWKKQGPWAGQHDVDILDDHRIAVFDNNAYLYRRSGLPKVKDTNQIIVYDFSLDRTSKPWKDLFSTHQIRSLHEGLFDILPGGYLLVDEATSARVMLFDKNGETVAEFVNRANDGYVYQLGWTRAVSRELGDKALAAVRAVDCG